MTIIFTTQPYNKSKQKPSVLIISKDSFHEQFGPIFSSRAIFAFTKEINPNFWDRNRLLNLS
jgi:hypothetical protein